MSRKGNCEDNAGVTINVKFRWISTVNAELRIDEGYFISITNPVFTIPAYALQNHGTMKMAPFEISRIFKTYRKNQLNSISIQPSYFCNTIYSTALK